MDAVSMLVVLLGQKFIELNWLVYRRRRLCSLLLRDTLVGFGFSAACYKRESDMVTVSATLTLQHDKNLHIS